MAENAEYARKQGFFFAINHDELVDQIFNQGLCHGKAGGGHDCSYRAGKFRSVEAICRKTVLSKVFCRISVLKLSFPL